MGVAILSVCPSVDEPSVVVDVLAVSTEACPALQWSEVVHKYSPRQRHDGHVVSDDDTTYPSQFHSDDDDEEDDVGSSDGAQPAARGRYGRRYDPPDSVVVVQRPSATSRTKSVTGHALQSAATTSGCVSITHRRFAARSVDVHLALSLFAFDYTTLLHVVVRLLFHRLVDCLSASVAVSLYTAAVSLHV